MRRAVILATLTLLLLTVAGVTAARESTFTSSPRAGDQTEFTAPEATTPETTVPETTVHEDLEEPDEGTAEATVVVPEEPKEPQEGDPGVGNYGGIQDDDKTEVVARGPAGEPGKLEHARGGTRNGEPLKAGKPEHPGKPPVGTKINGAVEAGEKPTGGNPGKVTLCHKNKVTISVGAPAGPAHLRHGDRLGAC